MTNANWIAFVFERGIKKRPLRSTFACQTRHLMEETNNPQRKEWWLPLIPGSEHGLFKLIGKSKNQGNYVLARDLLSDFVKPVSLFGNPLVVDLEPDFAIVFPVEIDSLVVDSRLPNPLLKQKGISVFTLEALSRALDFDHPHQQPLLEGWICQVELPHGTNIWKSSVDLRFRVDQMILTEPMLMKDFFSDRIDQQSCTKRFYVNNGRFSGQVLMDIWMWSTVFCSTHKSIPQPMINSPFDRQVKKGTLMWSTVCYRMSEWILRNRDNGPSDRPV